MAERLKKHRERDFLSAQSLAAGVSPARVRSVHARAVSTLALCAVCGDAHTRAPPSRRRVSTRRWITSSVVVRARGPEVLH